MSKRAKNFYGNVEVACAIGLSDSIIFNKILYWGKSKSGKTREGKSGWFYKTYEEFHDEDFPFLTLITIKRVIKSLKEKGLVESGEFNNWGADRTRWYRIADDANIKIKSILDESMVSKRYFAKYQNDTMPKCQKDTSNNHVVHNQEVLTINLDLQSIGDAKKITQKENDLSFLDDSITCETSPKTSAPTNSRLAGNITTLEEKRHLVKLPFCVDESLVSNSDGEYPAEAYQLLIDFARENGLREDYESKNSEAINRTILKSWFSSGYTPEKIAMAIEEARACEQEFGWNLHNVYPENY